MLWLTRWWLFWESFSVSSTDFWATPKSVAAERYSRPDSNLKAVVVW